MNMISRWIRRMYDWALGVSRSRHATWGLAGVSFLESSIFPIPPDVVLIPMCIANRSKAFRYAAICTASSVLGGVLGYAIGYYLYESVGTAIVHFYGMETQFETLKSRYAEWGGWIIFAKGLTPLPYKIFTILSGVLHLGLPVFIVASVLSRALRFYLVAGLLWKYGAPVQAFIEKRLTLLTCLFLVVLIAGFAALKYII